MMARPRIAALTAAAVPVTGLAVVLLAPSAARPPTAAAVPDAAGAAADRSRQAAAPAPQGRRAGLCAWIATDTTKIRAAPRVTAPAVKQVPKGKAQPCKSVSSFKGGRYRACGGAGDRWVSVYWGPAGRAADRTGYMAARCVTFWKS
ncbi:hypothetical protein ACFVH6_44610 [Spirillospora sp. NPDC127200]